MCDPALEFQFNSYWRKAVVSTFGLPKTLAHSITFAATLSPSPIMRIRSRWLKLIGKLKMIDEPIPESARLFLNLTSDLGSSAQLDSMLATWTCLSPEATNLWKKYLLKERCRDIIKLRACVFVPAFRIISGNRSPNTCACMAPLS